MARGDVLLLAIRRQLGLYRGAEQEAHVAVMWDRDDGGVRCRCGDVAESLRLAELHFLFITMFVHYATTNVLSIWFVASI